MANNENEHVNASIRTIREYLQPPCISTSSCFIFPLNTNNFRVRPGMIPLIPNFHGLELENPYLHLKEFEEVCVAFNDQGCNEEIIRLKLFSFSLKDKAKTWFNSLKPRSIGTWQEMQCVFLKKFFPSHKTIALKRQIQNFFQKENETFFQCWERFKDLLNSCPYHGFEKWCAIGFFYEGLTLETKQFIETMCNGEFLDKDPEEAFDYLDHLAEISQNWQTTNSLNSVRSNLVSSNGGKNQLNQENDLNARVANLSRKIEAMEMRKLRNVKSIQNEEDYGIYDIHEYPINEYQNFSSPYFNPHSHHSSRLKTFEETLQAFIHEQTIINNEHAHAINEIKNTLSILTSSLHEKNKFHTQTQLDEFDEDISCVSEKPFENVNAITNLCTTKVIDNNDEIKLPKVKSDERKEESKPCEIKSVQKDEWKENFEELPTNVNTNLPLKIKFPNLKLKPLSKNHKNVSLEAGDIFLGNGQRLKILDDFF